jgi:hypothetical protein
MTPPKFNGQEMELLWGSLTEDSWGYQFTSGKLTVNVYKSHESDVDFHGEICLKGCYDPLFASSADSPQKVADEAFEFLHDLRNEIHDAIIKT